jgi:hypothetical protein
MAGVEQGILVHFEDADTSFGQWRNVLIIVRRGRQRLDHVVRQQRAAQEYLRSSDSFALLYVYEPTAELPDRACRFATAKVLAELRPHVTRIGIVFEGDGLRFAMMRVVVRSLGAIFGHDSGRFIGARVEDAARWMTPILAPDGGSIDAAAALVEAVAALRARAPGGARAHTSRTPETVQREVEQARDPAKSR